MSRPRRPGPAATVWSRLPIVSGLVLVIVFGGALAARTRASAVALAWPQSADGTQEPATPAKEEAVEPDPVGAELTARFCFDQCHTTERITMTRRAAFEWGQVMLDMEARGAQATPEEFQAIQRYLTRRYGLVNMNRASASELAAVLGLSMPTARAVVEYRRAHGPFADLAAVAEVPGVDRDALEAEVDAVRFE